MPTESALLSVGIRIFLGLTGRAIDMDIMSYQRLCFGRATAIWRSARPAGKQDNYQRID